MNYQAEIITCPDCSAPHNLKWGNVCEICGYNFTTGAHGEIPYIMPKVKNVSYSASHQGAAEYNGILELNKEDSASPSLRTWELVAIIDPALCKLESPEPPINQSPLFFRLSKEINLIGRFSQKKGVKPEISLDFDDAISHRHAQILFQANNSLIIRDIGSSNGTVLNEIKLPPMKDFPLKDGDQITLGHWTKLIVQLR